MGRRRATHVDSATGVGRRLRAARQRTGLSQGALAAAAGCSAGYVSLVEAGKRVPSLQAVRAFADRLGASEAWLARGVAAEPQHAVEAALRDAELALRLEQLDAAEAAFAELRAAPLSSRERARVAAGLGQLAFRRDALEDAIAQLEHALELDPELDDASALDVLGRAYFRSGDTAAAIALFRTAQARAEEAGDPAARLRFAVLLANALTDVGAFGEATALLSRLIEHARGADAITLARVYWTQARLHTQQSEHEQAARCARRALDLLELTEHTYYRAKAHHLLAFCELDAGRAESALGLLEDGLALLGEEGTANDRAELELDAARALAMLDRPDEAIALAMQTAGRLGSSHPANLGRGYALIAATLAGQGELGRACELYELALERLEEPDTRYLAETLARYAGVLERLERRDAAFEAYKRSALLHASLVEQRVTT